MSSVLPMRAAPHMLPTLRVLLSAASPRIGSTVRECLILRALARAVLFGAPATIVEAKLDAARSCSAENWRVFLRTDRCAISLHAGLVQGKHLERLAEAAREALRESRDLELVRVLAARAQLMEIAGVAAELAMPVIVLKGGLAAIQGAHALDLIDVDLLVEEGNAERFARELDRRGYAPEPTIELPAAHHLAPRSLAGALPVEMHRRIEFLDPELVDGCFARARNVPALPGLQRLCPEDHAWSLLLHVTIHHPERRAALRDMVLVGDALRECSVPELSAVHSRIAAHAQARDLREALLAALAEGSGADDFTDSLIPCAAASYAAAAAITLREPPPPNWLSAPLRDLTFTLAIDRRKYIRHWSRITLHVSESVKRLRPGLRPEVAGRGLLVVLRTVRLLALTPVAALLAWQGARAARSVHAIIDTPLVGQRS